MATAEQLKEIRRKAGIGEFKGTNAQNSPITRPKRRRRARQPSNQDIRASRFNYLAPVPQD